MKKFQPNIMEKITLSQILRIMSMTDSRFYPFNDSFETNFTSILDPVIKNTYNNEVEFDPEGIELIEIFKTFNGLYQQLSELVLTAIKRTGLDHENFTKNLSMFCNDYCLFVWAQQKKSFETTEQNGSLENLTQMPGGQLKNENGQVVNANDVMDNVVDVCAELISFFISNNIQIEANSVPLEGEKLKNILHYLLEVGTAINTYKQEFEKFQCEETALRIEGDIISFKCDPPNYHFIKFANRQREFTGVFQTYEIAKNFEQEKLELPTFDISTEGEIVFNDSILEQLKTPHTSTSIFTSFYFQLHLADTATPDLNVNGIIEFVEAMEGLFIRCLQKNQAIPRPAFCIRQADLCSYVKSATELSKETIELLLGQFSQENSMPLDLWRKPLVSIGDFYYFFYPTITFGNFSGRFENLLAKHMSASELNRKFTEFISLQLSVPNENAVFKLVDPEVYSSSLKSDNTLVYETADTFVILKGVMLNYCLRPGECFNALAAASKYNEELARERDAIVETLMKIKDLKEIKLLSAIVTNHYQFSGMHIDGTLLVDPSLLVNYLIVGGYSKSIKINDPGLSRSEEIALYPYYTDKNSFNRSLDKFFSMPAPIEEIVSALKTEPFRISKEHANPPIFMDAIRLEPLADTIEDSIDQLKHYFRQLHYFEVDYKKEGMHESKEFLEQRIQYLLPIAFSYFALNRTDRNARIRLLDIFKEFGILAIANLVFGLHAQFKSLTSKPITKTQAYKIGAFDKIRAENHLAELMQESLAGSSVSLSTFELKKELSEDDTDNLINYLFDAASSFSPRAYNDGELTALYTLVMFATNLGFKKEKYKKLIYSMCENYIALLNQNGRFQRARDTAEEMLAFSLKRETYPLLGWLCLFKCFTAQKNAMDGCFYGILYFSVLNSKPIIEDFYAFDGIYNAFIYYRNFRYYDICDSLYKSLKSFELSEYDEQKISLSYFNSFLTRQTRTDQLIDGVEGFIKNHKDKIIAYGHLGCHPWVGLLYNMKNLEDAGALKLTDYLRDCIADFEKEVHPETLANLKAMMFKATDETELLFREALKKANDTRDLEDYVAELGNLELTANNLVRASVSSGNLEQLLLAGRVINDPTLTFEKKISEGFTRLSFDEEETTEVPFANNASTLLSEITMDKGDVICWILEYGDKVSALFIDYQKNHTILELGNWDIDTMKSWLDQGLGDFVFNEVKASINEQEQDYISALKALQFSTVTLPFECDQLLLYTSIELAGFPKNLILFDAPSDEECYHEKQPLVKEFVQEVKRDFISYYKPVTDIVSIERFAMYGKLKELPFKELTVEAWVPIDDEDMALYIAYNRMRMPLLESQCEIKTEIVPKPPLKGQINFIAAHGEKTVEGFKAVHTKEGEDGHAIINGMGTEHVFGQGLIAVVFICNSGYQSKKIYNQALTSFVNQLIELGYESVVAPAWKFNPEMCGVWTKAFLDGLKSGLKLSFAVYNANKVTSNEGFDEFWGFYAPSGWAAMHIYGNPNIRYV